MSNELHKKESKFLSYILRHDPKSINLDMDHNGWVKTQDIIQNSKESKYKFTMRILEDIVNSDEKSRYEFNQNKTMIRAVQGHSIKDVIMDYEEYIPTEVLYHGTSVSNYKEIIKSGSIISKSRNYVHLSKDLQTASNVGSRHGELKLITIDAAKMKKDGFNFYEAKNGVILVDEVPTKYFIHN